MKIEDFEINEFYKYTEDASFIVICTKASMFEVKLKVVMSKWDYVEVGHIFICNATSIGNADFLSFFKTLKNEDNEI